MSSMVYCRWWCLSPFGVLEMLTDTDTQVGNGSKWRWETFWEWWGTLTWEPLPQKPWKPSLENLDLETFTWEPLLGNLYLEACTWEPWLGNLGGIGFGAAPVCSETFTMAEDPKASAVGKKSRLHATESISNQFSNIWVLRHRMESWWCAGSLSGLLRGPWALR